MARTTHGMNRGGAIAMGDLAAALLLVAVISFGGWLWSHRRQDSGAAQPAKAEHAAAVVFSNVAPFAPVSAPSAKELSDASPLVALPTNSVRVTNAPHYKPGAILNAQIALDRMAISPGSIDGVMGSQTRSALRAFQVRDGLPVTGELDDATAARLSLTAPALTKFVINSADTASLNAVPSTWIGKSEQAHLGFETLLELTAERCHSHPSLVRRLNPTIAWTNVSPLAEIILPSVERFRSPTKAAFLRIQLAARTLQAFDSEGRLLAHFPCSIARRLEKRPLGELHITTVAQNPNYTFDPDVFPESEEGRFLGRKLILPPGPNNPVGTVWIGLDRPGYGIHGTPRPEEVGRTESHGCFRLANWNAEHLLTLVSVGTLVLVDP